MLQPNQIQQTHAHALCTDSILTVTCQTCNGLLAADVTGAGAGPWSGRSNDGEDPKRRLTPNDEAKLRRVAMRSPSQMSAGIALLVRSSTTCMDRSCDCLTT
jgi:hypothetical protein